MVYVLHHGVFVVGYICIVCVCRSHLSIYEILYEFFFSFMIVLLLLLLLF
jgi:hypothetical protein